MNRRQRRRLRKQLGDDKYIERLEGKNIELSQRIRQLEQELQQTSSSADVSLQHIPYDPPTEIQTMDDARVYIENLERTVDSYQANVDAILRIYQRDERLTVIKKDNGNLEPYYSSSQWAAMHQAIHKNATRNVVDYAMDYLFPYAHAASRLQQVMQSVSNDVFKLKTTELKESLKGYSGVLLKALADLIEKRELAYLANDLSMVADDVKRTSGLILEFVSNPTNENHNLLKDRFEGWKTVSVEQLLNYRDSLPDLGRPTGISDKRVIIWQYARKYYDKFGAESSGEKTIEELEAFMDEKGKDFENVPDMFPNEHAALMTLKYTTRQDGTRWERKNLDSSKSASLAGYMRKLAWDARNGKIKVASQK